MFSKRTRGNPGFQDKLARRKFWRTPSQLTRAKGVDMQVLFRVQCVDAVALQTMLL